MASKRKEPPSDEDLDGPLPAVPPAAKAAKLTTASDRAKARYAVYAALRDNLADLWSKFWDVKGHESDSDEPDPDEDGAEAGTADAPAVSADSAEAEDDDNAGGANHPSGKDLLSQLEQLISHMLDAVRVYNIQNMEHLIMQANRLKVNLVKMVYIKGLEEARDCMNRFNSDIGCLTIEEAVSRIEEELPWLTDFPIDPYEQDPEVRAKLAREWDEAEERWANFYKEYGMPDQSYRPRRGGRLEYVEEEWCECPE